MTHALVLHHDANSTSGTVGRHLAANGWSLTDHRLCDDPRSPAPSRALPDLDGVDLLVLTGSQWSVYDDESIGAWIHDELDLIRDADDRGIAVFGMCFGGQALAAALGGTVELAPTPEVGWFEVQSDEPEISDGPWFQWHFDRFDPPPDATVLARSPAGVQAFRLRRNLGLQFHPELDSQLLDLWVSSDHEELRAAGIDPVALVDRTRREMPRATIATATLLDWFLGQIASAERSGNLPEHV